MVISDYLCIFIMKMSNQGKKKRKKKKKNKYKMYNFWRKWILGNLMLKLSFMFKQMRSLKKDLVLNGIMEVKFLV